MMEEKVTREQLAEAFRQANASNAIEGIQMTPEGLALQQRVIDGDWTMEQYRAHIRTIPKRRNVA